MSSGIKKVAPEYDRGKAAVGFTILLGSLLFVGCVLYKDRQTTTERKAIKEKYHPTRVER